MSIFCIGQSAYDITIPLKEPLIKNRKYRIEKCHDKIIKITVPYAEQIITVRS